MFTPFAFVKENRFIIATGGTVTTDGNFKIHTFTTTGSNSLVINQVGSGDFNTIEYFVLAGGGAGGNGAGGGGGAGGLLTGSINPTITTYNIFVGAGGENSPTISNGQSSSFGNISATGGGRGNSSNESPRTGSSGGSGGGGASAVPFNPDLRLAGTGIPGQGQNGGNGNTLGSGPCVEGDMHGGGGGGYSVTGSVGTSGGNGGNGVTINFNGTSTTYAGGGGGGGGFYTVAGSGGTGGGGNAGDTTGTPGTGSAGTDGLGGGGGAGSVGPTCGSSTERLGARGGNGIVMIKYQFQQL